MNRALPKPPGIPITFPSGHLVRYYFDCRRRGFAPRGARNCTVTHAAATELKIPDSEAAHLKEFYARPGHYTGD